MKFLNEFRNGEQAKRLVERIARSVTRPWSIMEVCGGQTHSLIRNGIDQVFTRGSRDDPLTGMSGMCDTLGNDR